MAARTPHTRALHAFLADGEWHPYNECVAVLIEAIPPQVAISYARRVRAAEARRFGRPTPKQRLTDERLLISGRLKIIQQVLRVSNTPKRQTRILLERPTDDRNTWRCRLTPYSKKDTSMGPAEKIIRDRSQVGRRKGDAARRNAITVGHLVDYLTRNFSGTEPVMVVSDEEKDDEYETAIVDVTKRPRRAVLKI